MDTFRAAKGPDAPTQAGFKVAWGPTRDEAIDAAYELWPSSGVPGELSQVLLSPQHFEQASELVTREKFAENGAFGPDVADAAQASYSGSPSTAAGLASWPSRPRVRRSSFISASKTWR